MRLALLTLVAVLTACAPSLADQQREVERFAQRNRFGASQDFFLVKQTLTGEWEKVALIYGFSDDLEFCQEVAEGYMKRYPASNYTCQPAN